MLRQVITAPLRAGRTVPRSSSLVIPSRSPLRAVPIIALRSGQPAARRWYGAETDSKPAAEAAKDGDAAESKEAAGPEDALKKDLETKTKEALEWKDKYLRSVADFRNLQDRTARDMKAARDFAIQGFAKDLVDSVDNLDRALSMVPEEKLSAKEKTEHQQDLANLYDGLKMTDSILMATLRKHGLERFDPVGEKFNPNEHEATFMTPQPDKENNTVFHVQQKGFKLHSRVLRAAKVGVVKN